MPIPNTNTSKKKKKKQCLFNIPDHFKPSGTFEHGLNVIRDALMPKFCQC